jgi:hypothetical protein
VVDNDLEGAGGWNIIYGGGILSEDGTRVIRYHVGPISRGQTCL